MSPTVSGVYIELLNETLANVAAFVDDPSPPKAEATIALHVLDSSTLITVQWEHFCITTEESVGQ